MIEEWLDPLDATGRWALLKLITGGLRVGVSARLAKVASRLFSAICDRFRDRGVDKLRSMVATDDLLNLAFLRAQGMRGGPYLQLEMTLGQGAGK